MTIRILETVMIGIGATVGIDLWALLLRLMFRIQSLDYCLLGRWILTMPEGRVMHTSIGASAPMSRECAAGWIAHYSIGIGFALLFIALVGAGWMEKPTPLPALAFGVATVAVPFFTMQPAFGLGIAASRTKNPAAARVKSVATHAIFGLGLYVVASLLSTVA